MQSTHRTTARSPGDTRPHPQYEMFLDAGGELASLDDGDELSSGALEHAVAEQNELTFDILAKQIDETGQLDDKQRNELDDMPAGEAQTQQARKLLMHCRSKCNDMFVFLCAQKCSALRALASSLAIDKDDIYKAAAKPGKIQAIARLIYFASDFNKFGDITTKRSRDQDQEQREPEGKRQSTEAQLQDRAAQLLATDDSAVD